MKPVAYISHPLGAEDSSIRASNIDNALTWLSFLVTHTKWAIVCSWIPYANSVRDDLRPRSLVDSVAVLERCDCLLLTGSHVSSHMNIERDHAVRRGMPIVDLTPLGARPPLNYMTDVQVVQFIREQAERAVKLSKRAAWFTLTYAEVEALREARARLQPIRPDDVTQQVVDRVIAQSLRRRSLL